jgi:ribosomal protein L11 methyltransferase
LGATLALRVTVPRPAEDDVVVRLSELGTLGIEHRPDEGDRSALVAYFPGGSDLQALVASLRTIEATLVEAVAVPEVDWVARFREGFRPFEAAGFRVVPAWEPGARPGPDTLVVDPGQAFGTGTHESTRLCLLALRRLAEGSGALGRVLDVGTGTGLLAVAALRLGATSACGSDVDAEALFSGVGGRAVRGGCCETLVANLTASLLAERRDELLRAVRPGGRLLLSGLLVSDLPAVREAYAGLRLIEELRDGEWAALVLETTPA